MAICTDQKLLAVAKTGNRQCRYVFPDGHHCTAWAVRNRPTCVAHGGTGGRPISTTQGYLRALEREANREGSETHAAIELALNEPDLLSLERHAAMCRVIADRVADRLDVIVDPDTVMMALSAIEVARKVVESIAKVNLMRQELLSKKQTEATYSVLESIFALCLENPDLPVSVILDQLRERLFNFRAVAQLPEPAIEAEIVE